MTKNYQLCVQHDSWIKFDMGREKSIWKYNPTFTSKRKITKAAISFANWWCLHYDFQLISSSRTYISKFGHFSAIETFDR